MNRGEVWLARLETREGQRPVVLLTRQVAPGIRTRVTVAPITTRIRRIAVEVPVGTDEGLEQESVVNADNLQTIYMRSLVKCLGRLSAPKLTALEGAVRFALGMKP